MVIRNYDCRLQYTKYFVILGLFGLLTTVIGGLLASSYVSAEDGSVIDQVRIAVPVACTIKGTGMQSHNANINNGLYEDDIGSTVLHAFCNDNEGFAIYAAGYTGNEVGGTNSNKLVGTTASGNATIESGIATTAGNPDVSNWAMKLTMTQDSGDTTTDNAFTIDSAPNVALPSQAESGATQAPFSDYHVVPNEYVKVAHKNSGTDMTETTGGVKLTTTYAAYISKTQPADTYSGQVIYTLVHPASHPIPQTDSMLITGKELSNKLKNLSGGITDASTQTLDTRIKAIRMVDSLPDGFVATAENTVTTPESAHPVYIFFDNTDDAGIMYFYSGGYQVTMNPDSSFAFLRLTNLSDISGLKFWDTSKVTNMRAMFACSASKFTNLDAISAWNVSNVTDMSLLFASDSTCPAENYLHADISGLARWDVSNVTTIANMFQGATGLVSLGGLESWDTSKVTTMRNMFFGASNLSDISALANWDTSNVETMYQMFYDSSSLSDISALANWDTSNVTTMQRVFQRAHSLSDISALANWDTSKVTTMSLMFASTSSLSDISALANWDTSKVEDMEGMFIMESGLGVSKLDLYLDLSPLTNWNVANVANMREMFYGNNILSFSPLRNWNVGKVKNFYYTFAQTNNSTTTTLAGLENWNVSSATDMRGMFSDSVSLTDASAINNWNITNVTATASSSTSAANKFFKMFQNSPTHPTFTRRAGTWNSEGTFIPSE